MSHFHPGRMARLLLPIFFLLSLVASPALEASAAFQVYGQCLEDDCSGKEDEE